MEQPELTAITELETCRHELCLIGIRFAKIMMQMGKSKPGDELNCGMCGYETCREKAIACINELGVPATLKRSQKFLGHHLQITWTACTNEGSEINPAVDYEYQKELRTSSALGVHTLLRAKAIYGCAPE